MHVTTYPDASAFLARVEAVLARNEAANGLMYGLARQLIYDPHLYGQDDPFFATVDEGDDLRAATLRTPPFNLLVQSDAPDPDPALAILAGHLHERGADLPGVNGSAPLSAAFARHWSRLTGVPHRQKMALRVFELRGVHWPADPPDGRLRPVRRSEADILADWIFKFRSEAMGKEGEDGQAWAEGRAERALDEGGVYFWDDGGPVSLVSHARSTPRGATVNMVYTPPPFRKRGYASVSVAVLSQQLLDRGYDFCTLFTDLANPTSNHIYQEIGYRPVCDFAEMGFET